MRRYDKRIRSFAEDNQPVIVEVTIVMAILTELNFVCSHLQFLLLWAGKSHVYRTADIRRRLLSYIARLKVRSDGSIKLNIPQFVTCLYRPNIDPFSCDTQFCVIAQASPLLNIGEMDINATNPPMDSYFAGNAEWEIANVSVRHIRIIEDGEYRSEASWPPSVKTYSSLKILSAVAHCFCPKDPLNCFPFCCRTSALQVSLGLGSLLAMTVLLDIVASAMPKSSSIPLLGYYIVAVILLCAVAVGVSMASLAISRQLIQNSKKCLTDLHTTWFSLLRKQTSASHARRTLLKSLVTLRVAKNKSALQFLKFLVKF
uniref:Neur_chan_LBD domain-containing protein n=1 Tax=Ascaris lumbricoides TaxID=6252 RepID=A0A0M3I7P4_ASCLU